MNIGSVLDYFSKPVGIAVIFCSSVAASYTVWILFFTYDPVLERLISSLAIILLGLVFVGFGFHLTSKSRLDPRERRAWGLITVATLSWVVGECIWLYYESFLRVSPSPSIADLFFLLFWLLIFVGILSFPFVPVAKNERVLLTLDLSIVITTGFLILWYSVVSDMQWPAEFSVIGMVTIIYPAASLLAFAAIVALIQRDVRHVARPVLLLLAAGMLCNLSLSAFFSYSEIHDIGYPVVLNSLWMCFILFMLAAISLHKTWNPASDTLEALSHFSASHLLLRGALPYLAIVISFIFVCLAFTSESASEYCLYGVLFAALLLVGLVSLRQHMLLRENIHLYKKMEHLAITDALTGVFNRHFINEVLRSETERGKRNFRELSVLLIDVDGFKKYNDTRGHLEGDIALRNIAGALRSQLRSSDTLGRFGGDEFVAILYDCVWDGARAVAEKMKSAVADIFQNTHPIGVSIGIGIFRQGMSAEELLQEADKELYEQKSSLYNLTS